MRRLELHPIDTGFLLVGSQAHEAVVQGTVCSVACVALRHHDEIRIELVLHVNGSAIACDGLIERNNGNTSILGAARSFDRLIVDTNAGNASANTFAYHPPHRHDATMTSVAVHDHGEPHGLRDPPTNRHAFQHCESTDIGQ